MPWSGTISFSTSSSKQSQDDYDFEISISNLAYRGLRIKEGQMVNVAFKWESIWVIPEE